MPLPMPQSSTRSPLRQLRGLLRERDRDGRGAHVAVRRVGDRHAAAVEAGRLHERVRVHAGHLMHDVAVHVGPVPVALRLGPGGGDELHPAAQQRLRVGEHALHGADAEVVELGRGPGDAADHAVPLRVPVGAAEHRGGDAAAEGEARELAHELRAVEALLGEPLDRVDLDVADVLAVDDHRVVDLTGLDEARREVHPVHEAEARVRDVEVDRIRAEAEPVVQPHGHARLDVPLRDRGVDEQPDVAGLHAGLPQRLVARLQRRLVEREVRAPVPPLDHAGHPLQQPGGQAELLQDRLEPPLDLEGGRDDGSEHARHREQGDIAVRRRRVSVQGGLQVVRAARNTQHPSVCRLSDTSSAG